MRFMEGRMEYDEHNEHNQISLKETTSFHKNNICLFSYKFPFYRIKGIGVMVRRHFAVVIPRA